MTKLPMITPSPFPDYFANDPPTCFIGANSLAHLTAVLYAQAYHRHTIPCIYLNPPLDNLHTQPTKSLTYPGKSSIIKEQ